LTISSIGESENVKNGWPRRRRVHRGKTKTTQI
jgi:hypothetical protein